MAKTIRYTITVILDIDTEESEQFDSIKEVMDTAQQYGSAEITNVEVVNG